MLGYVTMGSNLSTALCLYIIGFLLAKVSLTGTFLVWGVIYLVLGVLSFALLRDNPEELGEFPDNDRSLTQEQVQEQFRQGEEYRKNGGLDHRGHPEKAPELADRLRLRHYPAHHRGYPVHAGQHPYHQGSA